LTLDPRSVRIVYKDHVLFKNIDPSQITPSLREAIGWIFKQNQEAIWLCFDKPILAQPFEKQDIASGLCILRTDIIEVTELG